MSRGQHSDITWRLPEQVLIDLVLSVVNAAANDKCSGCEACDRYRTAALAAWYVLSPRGRQIVQEAADRQGVDLLTWQAPRHRTRPRWSL